MFSTMLKALKELTGRTRTENGAAALTSTLSHCLDLFGTIGALREASEEKIIRSFVCAYAENPDLAMRTLFYARDIRGGLGERRVFRVLIRYLADHEPQSVRKNLAWIAEMGRYDDLLVLLGTACEADAVAMIARQLEEDTGRMERGEPISLLAKWLPSVNTSSAESVRKGRYLARKLGMREADYRRTLSRLRAHMKLLENRLREQDYTFSYEEQPSGAMLKYRKADTPVGIVTAASRDKQSKVISTLADFTKEEINMFSLVIIGNSQTYVQEGWMVTPRGYENKETL